MPRRGELCECEKGKGRVADRNMLTQMVTLSLEDGGTVTLHASELKYRLRGKAPEMKKVVKEEPAEYEMPVFSALPDANKNSAAAVKEESAGETQKNKENRDNNNSGNNNHKRNNKRRNNKRRNRHSNQEGGNGGDGQN